eukprot:SAG31_NODE_20806_length_565_cov_0.658798_1_plen_37_part_10
MESDATPEAFVQTGHASDTTVQQQLVASTDNSPPLTT